MIPGRAVPGVQLPFKWEGSLSGDNRRRGRGLDIIDVGIAAGAGIEPAAESPLGNNHRPSTGVAEPAGR